ncbi:MAG: hypothetical protein JJ863_14435 [Deltaproteobacteria bacterium]|nr:hypothetical protein [Deltaproteobacteria bacterium]
MLALIGCGAKSSLDDSPSATTDEGSPGRRDASTPSRDGAPPDGTDALDAFVPLPCEPMPPRSLPLPSRSAAAPSLAFDGRTYGILWVEMLDGGGCGLGEWSFSRLSKSGAMTDGAIFLGDGGPRGATGTLHVIDGEFWAILGGELGLRAFPLDAPSPDPIVLSDRPTIFHDAVVMDDGRVAVASTEGDPDPGTTLRVFEDFGSPMWTSRLPEYGWVSIAERGGALTVAISNGFERVSAMTVSAGGSPSPPIELYRNTTGSSFISGFAEAATLDEGSVVFFARSGARPRPIEAGRLGADGRIRDIRPVGEAARTLYPTAARDEATGDVGVLWKHSPEGAPSYSLRFRRLDRAGELVGEESDALDGHNWNGCGELDRMALVSSITGWGFATASGTAGGGSQIIFGEICR